uniref:Uncharacterized protein LOC117364690 isoform X2 n=1 Tax=Geotrypetes seraphini TaxID=260995 RepID=A0A6P8RZD0_GEOSA|nr:uncharacterized protein LOC117364690 isoform X2 [Geotrypetes seraphini]
MHGERFSLPRPNRFGKALLCILTDVNAASDVRAWSYNKPDWNRRENQYLTCAWKTCALSVWWSRPQPPSALTSSSIGHRLSSPVHFTIAGKCLREVTAVRRKLPNAGLHRQKLIYHEAFLRGWIGCTLGSFSFHFQGSCLGLAERWDVRQARTRSSVPARMSLLYSFSQRESNRLFQSKPLAEIALRKSLFDSFLGLTNRFSIQL